MSEKWVDPFYPKWVASCQVEVTKQSEVCNKLKEQLQWFDETHPEARTARASGNIGGISLYFSGTVERKRLAFNLKQERSKLKELKLELSRRKTIAKERKGAA